MFNLTKVLRSMAASGDASEAFVDTFIRGGRDYPCPNGQGVGRDFDPYYRGLCAGFAYDGSSTFYGLPRLAETPQGFDLSALVAARGEPNAAVLHALAGAARRVTDRGGRMLLIMPPLAPGLEARLTQSGIAGVSVRRTKAALQEFAARHDIALFDAGASETFGCAAAEFVDAVHADPNCWRKVAPALPH
jgi:hypothetical protein